MAKELTDYKLYHWRYYIAAVALGLLAVVMFGFALWSSPDGIDQAEIDSVVESSEVGLRNFTAAPQIVELPYKIIQKISVRLIGLRNFSIKLPSILLGAGTTLGIVLIVRFWINRRAGLIAGLLALATSQLLFLSQYGTPKINLLFLMTAIVLILTKVATFSTQQTNYKLRYGRFNNNLKANLFKTAIGLAISFGLLVYSRLGLYVAGIIGLVVALHPYMRLAIKTLFKQIDSQQKIIVGVIMAVLLLPMVVNISTGFEAARSLLDFDNFSIDVLPNLALIGERFISLVPKQPSLANAPILLVGSTVLALLGLFRILPNLHKPAELATILSAILIITASLFNPNLALLLLIPLWAMLGFGVEWLFNSWYELFPRNPYARVAGMIPISLLIGFSLLAGISFHVDYYHYTPGVANLFRNDLLIVKQQLAEHSRVKVVATSADNQLKFYKILAQSNNNLSVSETVSQTDKQRQLVTRKAVPDQKIINNYQLVLPDRFRHNADRFYVYQKTDK